MPCWLSRPHTARGEPFDSLALSLSKGELAQDVLVERDPLTARPSTGSSRARKGHQPSGTGVHPKCMCIDPIFTSTSTPSARPRDSASAVASSWRNTGVIAIENGPSAGAVTPTVTSAVTRINSPVTIRASHLRRSTRTERPIPCQDWRRRRDVFRGKTGRAARAARGMFGCGTSPFGYGPLR